jgi:SNF2 family DNA or RNA helicase
MASSAAAAKTIATREKEQAIYGKLLDIRKSKTCSLRPTPMLRTEIVGLDGKTEPFKLRYYQVQGVLHLLMMKRMVLGDGTGLGKTITCIAFLCYLWEKSEAKCIVVCPKTVIRQWASEVDRFSTGIKTFLATGGPEKRKDTYEAWAAHTGPDKAILVLNYHSLMKDWNAGQVIPMLPNGQPDPKTPMQPGLLDRITQQQKNLIAIFDEASAFKNPSSKRWEVSSFLSQRCDRAYGLTATLLKNNLIEGFGIYKVIHPGVFTTKTGFLTAFCVTQLQPIKGSKRKIPIIVGYKNLVAFRSAIDPYFLGRPKHAVSDELPKLITKEITCEMTPAEDRMYSKALSGVLELGDGTVKEYEEYVAFVALTYCQQVVNSLSLLKYDPGDSVGTSYFEAPVEVDELGSKEEALLDLLTDGGELEGEKTIIYTRFASFVPRLQKLLADHGIKSVAITGNVIDTEKNPRRKLAQDAFQNPESGIQVIVITDAGGEGINLQAAAAMVFIDAPWSWGNYVQLLGRPIRIGSQHPNVIAIHLVSERPREKAKDRKSIDHHTLELLRRKKDLIDKVLGEAAVGALDFGDKSFKRELVEMLARSV